MSKKVITIILIILLAISGSCLFLEKNTETNIIDNAQKFLKNIQEELISSENIDNWELGLVFYDSTVDNGQTALTKIDWDASDNDYKTGAQRTITMQINYRNINAVTTYAPGELKITIPNLIYDSNYKWKENSPYWTTDVTVGANSSLVIGEKWNFLGNTPSNSQEYYSFTNAETIYAESNFEGSIQIIYIITPTGETYPCEFKDECICSRNMTLKVSLNRCLEEAEENITESNKIDFKYRRIYSHPWERANYQITKTPQKIVSLDKFENPNDYIWVKYEMSYVRPWPSYPLISAIDLYIKDAIPENCVVLDENRNVLTSVDGEYKLNIDNLIGNDYLFVGYPNEEYLNKNNTNIENTVELWGTYKDRKEPEKLAENTVALNLEDFLFDFEGDFYKIDKETPKDAKIYYQNIIKSGATSMWHIKPTAYYTGSPMTLKIGDDILYSTESSSNEIVKLKDNEYSFKQIYWGGRNFANAEGKVIEYNKYDCELWVRYQDEEDYVLYDSFKNPESKTFIFLEEGKNVVGFYFIIKDVVDSIVPNGSGFIIPTTVFFKKNINQTGKMYNFNYLEVYFPDGSLKNSGKIDYYKGFVNKDEIANYDTERFGRLLQRNISSINWSYYTVKQLEVGMHAIKGYYDLPVRDNINQLFKGKFVIGANMGTNLVPNMEYKDFYDGTTAVSGFKLYDLLPLGMELISDEEDIRASLYPHFATTKSKPDIYNTNMELTDYTAADLVKDSEVKIIRNWKNTGRTKIEIVATFIEPVYITNEAFSTEFYYDYDYTISYYDYLQYGNTYTNSCYADLITSKYYFTQGRETKDILDINENGITDEKLSVAGISIKINDAISTYQNVTTFVQTDKNTYKTGTAYSSLDKEYSYRLRVCTGYNKSTGLIIYDNLEKAYKDNNYWNGEFIDIDTSFAKAQGYNVKTYYSENENAKNLYNKDGTLNSDWKSYYTHTEKPANGLAVTFNHQFKTENVNYDYVEIYYKLNGSIYKLGKWGGTTLAGKTINIPSKDFYLYWKTDGSSCSYYGFSIDDISPTTVSNVGTKSSLPSISPEEVSTYPDSAFGSYTHGNYGNNITKMWHYTYAGEMIGHDEEGPDTTKVKSLAFEYLDKDGKSAICEKNFLTYVEIKMKAPNEPLGTLSYNNCWTQWTALDDTNNPIDFITGINSNSVRVGLEDFFDITVKKIWDDENNKYDTRPDSIDVILKKSGVEIDRKQITKDNLTVTFSNLITAEAQSYSIEEEPLKFYIPTITYNDEDDCYEIKNSLDDNKFTEITGSKIWREDDETIRPENITINLLKDGKIYRTTTTNKEQDWKYSFIRLPIYNSDESKCVYTIEEVSVNNYITQYSDGIDENVSLTSGLSIKFNDKCRTEHINSDYVEIYYIQNGETYKLGRFGGFDIAGKEVKVPTNNFYLYWHTNWREGGYYGYSIDSIEPISVDNIDVLGEKANLPDFEIKEVKERNYPESKHNAYGNDIDDLWHYSGQKVSSNPEEGLYNIINIYDDRYTNIIGTKTWIDDVEANRPESITINLLQNGNVYKTTITNASNEWKYTFENVPVYDKENNEYQYTVEEVPVEFYTTMYSDENKFDIINIFNKPEETEITVQKIWNDYNNYDGIRPPIVEIQLYANKIECGEPISLDSKNDWKYTWINLPKKENGEDIKYTVREIGEIDGYEASYSEDTFTITNTHKLEQVLIQGKKIWEDNENQDGIRPESITINLFADGEKIDSKLVSEQDNWEWTFEDLDKYKDGVEIQYTITEENVENYTSKIEDYNITNIHTPEKTGRTVQKIWNDANNQDGIRPESVEVQLFADGEAYGEVIKLYQENEWKYTWENLPEKRNGKKIEYTVKETEETTGYTTTYDSESFIINTIHEPEKISITGSKTWNDENNQESLRPDEITINLFANGEKIETKKITEEQEWKWTFKDLNKYSAGKEIEYTITEEEVESYKSEVKGYDIINTYKPSKITIKGAKTWDDNNNQDKIRPNQITINLLANGEKVTSKTITEKDEWKWTFENLDKYSEGKEIAYTISEDKVEGYETKIEGYNITNTHIHIDEEKPKEPEKPQNPNPEKPKEPEQPVNPSKEPAKSQVSENKIVTTTNTSNKETTTVTNSKNKFVNKMPDTGDILPVIAIGTIVVVIISNIIVTIPKRRKIGKHERR